MARNVLIIGAGGVAQVVAHKLAQNAREFGTLHIASRTVSKAEQIAASIRDKGHSVAFTAHPLDAMDSAAVADLIRRTGAKIVINVGTAFINKTVLKGCIAAGAAYIDTAIHEDPDKICETPPWYGNYEWKRREAVEAAVAETGRIFSVCFSERFIVPATIVAGKLIEDGAIGRVVQTLGTGPHRRRRRQRRIDLGQHVRQAQAALTRKHRKAPGLGAPVRGGPVGSGQHRFNQLIADRVRPQGRKRYRAAFTNGAQRV